ncbi:MAG TPA: hypothetical protein VKZ95_04390 [Sphingobacteriaceae bacterium]|nr:hypothetical protein [Sphingobacteriaceae bacterium]
MKKLSKRIALIVMTLVIAMSVAGCESTNSLFGWKDSDGVDQPLPSKELGSKKC